VISLGFEGKVLGDAEAVDMGLFSKLTYGCNNQI